MAVKFIDGVKLYVIREYAMMRDGTIICKIMDKQGRCIWASAECLEVFVG